MTSSVQDLMRKYEQELLHHPDVQAAVAEMEDIIRDRYPDAQFNVSIGDEPLGVYLDATVDVEDTDEVADLFMDRLLELQVEERIPVYVLPVSPLEGWEDNVPAVGAASCEG